MAKECVQLAAAWARGTPASPGAAPADEMPLPAAAAPVPLQGKHTLEERVRHDPPTPGVFRFYNTAFKMPERPRRGAN